MPLLNDFTRKTFAVHSSHKFGTFLSTSFLRDYGQNFSFSTVASHKIFATSPIRELVRRNFSFFISFPVVRQPINHQLDIISIKKIPCFLQIFFNGKVHQYSTQPNQFFNNLSNISITNRLTRPLDHQHVMIYSRTHNETYVLFSSANQIVSNNHVHRISIPISFCKQFMEHPLRF